MRSHRTLTHRTPPQPGNGLPDTAADKTRRQPEWFRLVPCAALSERGGRARRTRQHAKAQPRFTSYTLSTRSCPRTEWLPETVRLSSAWGKHEETSARSSLRRSVHAVDFENKIVDEKKITARQNGGGGKKPTA